jgi:hypothetical protein
VKERRADLEAPRAPYGAQRIDVLRAEDVEEARIARLGQGDHDPPTV